MRYFESGQTAGERGGTGLDGSPIRVLFIVPELPVGGGERIITKLLPSMDPARFHVSLICIGDKGELFDHVASAGIEATAFRAGGKRNALKALRELSSYLRSTKPDVIIVAGAGTAVIGRLAGLLNNVKHRVVWMHSSRVDRSSFVRDLVDRSLIPSTSRFLGVTEAQISFMETVCKFPATKIRIVRSGVDAKAFESPTDWDLSGELGLRLGQPVVAMVARLQPVKDHFTFLVAAKTVLDSLPETTFLVIGDGPQRGDLENICQQLGISESVHFTGTRLDIDRLLPAIDIHVLSSHSEGLPMAVLEGMACGKPVICTDVGGTSEIIEHGVSGYLVPPGEPAMLAAHLTALLTNPDLAERMGAAGKRRVESEFSFNDSVAEFEKFIMELVDS